jgi:hypothetical protein
MNGINTKTLSTKIFHMDSILHVELKIMSRVVYRHFSFIFFMTLYASYFNNFMITAAIGIIIIKILMYIKQIALN